MADGRSTDRTREIATSFELARVIDNPRRAQSAGLNLALREARGELIVRVDGHCVLADDYVETCVDALVETGAAMVGGAMSAVGEGTVARAIALAMGSRLGAGPARFHTGGPPGWVDTVYLGAFRRADALAVGGYAVDVGVNEDAELALRLAAHGGVWFDPRVRSEYTSRSDLGGVIRQFYRYGRSRATTVRRHPRSLRPRQAIAPLLVLGLLSPLRRQVALAYGATVCAAAARHAAEGVEVSIANATVLPAMHLSWGVGFLIGLAWGPPAQSRAEAVGEVVS